MTGTTDGRRWVRGVKTGLNLSVMALLVAVMVAALFYAGLQAMGYRFYEVLSPSMEPALGQGDVVAVKAVEGHEVEVGDVIAFEKPGFSVPILHRVSAVNSSPDIRSVFQDEQGNVVGERIEYAERTFRTKGDANPTVDVEEVPAAAVVGQQAFVVPWPLGLLVTAFEKTTLLAIGVGGILAYVAVEVASAVPGLRRRQRTAPMAGAIEDGVIDATRTR